MPPYFVPLTADEFGRLIPPRIGGGAFVSVGAAAESQFPTNPLRAMVAKLTAALNRRYAHTFGSSASTSTSTSATTTASAAPPRFDMVRLVQLRTIKDPSAPVVVAEAEAWYHMSGKSHGHVVLLQVTSSPVRPPFLRMTAARVDRTESEDVMLLHDGV